MRPPLQGTQRTSSSLCHSVYASISLKTTVDGDYQTLIQPRAPLHYEQHLCLICARTMYHRHSNVFCMSRIKTQPPTPSMGHHLSSLPWFAIAITASPTFTDWKSEENLFSDHEPYVTGSPSAEIYRSYKVTGFNRPDTFLFKSVLFKLSCCPLSGSQTNLVGCNQLL